jgi:hypothetical protein
MSRKTAKARLDADRTAKPKTRIVSSPTGAPDFDGDDEKTHCRTLYVPPGDTYVDNETGERIPLLAPNKSEGTTPGDEVPRDPLACKRCGHHMGRSRVRGATVRCGKCRQVHKIELRPRKRATHQSGEDRHKNRRP